MRSVHYNSTKIRKQISSSTQLYEKISDIYFLCSVSLSYFIAIQPSVWVFCSFFYFLHFCMIVVLYISLFIALYTAVQIVCLSCVVLFGLMATGLNKHYYYYYYWPQSHHTCEREPRDKRDDVHVIQVHSANEAQTTCSHCRRMFCPWPPAAQQIQCS